MLGRGAYRRTRTPVDSARDSGKAMEWLVAGGVLAEGWLHRQAEPKRLQLRQAGFCLHCRPVFTVYRHDFAPCPDA